MKREMSAPCSASAQVELFYGLCVYDGITSDPNVSQFSSLVQKVPLIAAVAMGDWNQPHVSEHGTASTSVS